MTAAQTADPFVTILINNHNYERFLGQAIDSALAQDYPNFEVIVVDDASSDGSRKVVEAYGSRIRTLFQPVNEGQNVAVSKGIAMARGELIFMLDADDIFLPGKLRRMVGLYREHPDGALFFHRLPNGSADLSRIGRGKPVTSPGDISRQLRQTNGSWSFQPTSSMAFAKRALAPLIPIPPVPSGGDVDFILAMLVPLFGPVYALDEALAARRLHDVNMYSHKERLANREWTLRDNISRTRHGLEAANKVLARLGEPFRYDPDGHTWTVEMRFQLGEVSTPELLWSRLRLLRSRGLMGTATDMVRTWQRSRPIRRRLQRRRRRGKAT